MRWSVIHGVDGPRGLATAESLVDGYEEHIAVPGLYGFSVQFAEDVSVEGLARAGRIRNGKISDATGESLQEALQPLGYTMRLVKSPRHGFHHTFVVVNDAAGMALEVLPHTAAEALSHAFPQRPNPYRVR